MTSTPLAPPAPPDLKVGMRVRILDTYPLNVSFRGWIGNILNIGPTKFCGIEILWDFGCSSQSFSTTVPDSFVQWLELVDNTVSVPTPQSTLASLPEALPEARVVNVPDPTH